MKKSELLAPAGSFECGKAALYSGADAIYLALEAFGARAYAKNFTTAELISILKIAHTLNKKVYVTVNTLIKNNELNSVYDFLDNVYTLGVDGVICADIAVFMYVINNCKGMECHISTQAGVKDLLDVKFFEGINANRVVIARENNIEQIKEIKENSNIELEVFIHGALCVSYSGGCLFSSLLSLRSGNRGRCSQNCRREYTIYENDKPISNPGYYLSMKDLSISNKVLELNNINIDSLKIEGRMKDVNYVINISKYYRNILDGKNADYSLLENIFHRQYTKGFIFGEDSNNITTIIDSSSQGTLIGSVVKKDKNNIYIKSNKMINIGDRLRFFYNDKNIYLTTTVLNKDNIGYYIINTTENIKVNSMVYRMNSSESETLNIDTNIVPLSIFVCGYKGNELSLTCNIYNDYITICSDEILQKAEKNPLTEDSIIKQLSKLNDTPFYIEDISFDIEDDLFISLSEINNLRRKLVEEIYNKYHSNRSMHERKPLFLKKRNIINDNMFVATVKSEQQYKACVDLGVNVFYKNISPYVNIKYNEIVQEEVLVSNYGGLYNYTNKILTTDYSFNVLNKDSILHLLNYGAQNITISPEISFNELKDLSDDFYKSYGQKAPIDYLVYGKIKLMTMKYCPLKRFGLCGQCRKNKYYLVDELGKFLICTRNDCYVEIYNNVTLNLIDDLNKISPYVNRFRFDFVDESYDDVVEILTNAKLILDGKINEYKIKNQTKGYFKRPII